MGSQQVSVELYNMKNIPIRIPKGTPMAHIVAANIILEVIVVDSQEAEERDVMTVQEW